MRFGFDMCPPIPRILPSSNPHPQLLHHEIHSATSAFCTLLLLFATSCAMNFVQPPPPVSPRFFILPHLPSDPLKPRFPHISACVHVRSCMCHLLSDQFMALDGLLAARLIRQSLTSLTHHETGIVHQLAIRRFRSSVQGRTSAPSQPKEGAQPASLRQRRSHGAATALQEHGRFHRCRQGRAGGQYHLESVQGERRRPGLGHLSVQGSHPI